ncbi:MAG: LLM class flavin-dependent oxidoreductase [Candidatus Ranarchaeia archaeon]
MTNLEFSVSLACQFPLTKLPKLGRVIEENRFGRVWINDQDTWRSVYATSTMIALGTSKLKFGPGLTNPYSRHPISTAIELATLHTDFGGRTILGLGPGDYWYLQSLGMRWSKVSQTLSETVQIIRTLTRGDAVDFYGEIFSASKIKLRFKPLTSPPIEIGLGSRGPRLAELAGRIGDCVLLDGIPRNALPEVIRRVRRGERIGKRSPGACRIGCFFAVGVDEDQTFARQKAKRYASWSIAMAHPYALDAANISKKETTPILNALPDLDAAAQLISDDLVQQFALTGTIEDIASQLEEYKRMGLEEVILMIPDDPGLQSTVKLFGKHVIPNI